MAIDRRTFAAALPAMAAACSPLRMFNAVMPKDSAGTLLVRGARFGSDSRQTLDLYAPRDRRAGPLPVIVFFYGGSWNSGSKDGYGFVGRALASRGFLVAIPDYRLVPAVRYPLFLDDNAAAVRWLRMHVASLGGDPHRLILAGHSAGAYNAAMLALDSQWLERDREGVRGLIGLAGPYDFLPLEGSIAKETFGTVADLEATQPVRYVTPGDPPAFLATADEDITVRACNSDSLAAKLRTAGVFVERRRYSRIGHVGLITAIALPFRHRAPVLDEMLAFAQGVSAF